MYLPWRHKNNQPLEYKSGLLKTMTDQGAAEFSGPGWALVSILSASLVMIHCLVSSQFEFYNFFLGGLIPFFMHALIHVMDFIRYKKYVPMILTTTLMLVYSVVAFHDVIVQVEVNWVRVAFWFAVTL